MVFRWTFHYLNFLFLSRQPFLCFFLHFMTPPKSNHKLYSWLINFDCISHNIRIWFTKFSIIKFSCFLLLVNFLPHLIHTSSSLGRTWPKGTKGPFFPFHAIVYSKYTFLSACLFLRFKSAFEKKLIFLFT